MMLSENNTILNELHAVGTWQICHGHLLAAISSVPPNSRTNTVPLAHLIHLTNLSWLRELIAPNHVQLVKKKKES